MHVGVVDIGDLGKNCKNTIQLNKALTSASESESESIKLELDMGNDSSKATSTSSSPTPPTAPSPVGFVREQPGMSQKKLPIPKKKGSLPDVVGGGETSTYYPSTTSTSIRVQVVHHQHETRDLTLDDDETAGKPTEAEFLEVSPPARSEKVAVDKGASQQYQDAGRCYFEEVDADQEENAKQGGGDYADEYCTSQATTGGQEEEDDSNSSSESDSESGSEDLDDTASAAGDEGGKRPAIPIKVFEIADLRNPEIVGDGGFGRVIRGSIHGARVAVKIFHSPIIVEDFHAKLASLTRLKHRNIVNMLGIIKTLEMDCPQIVLHYFPEGNIADFLRRRGATPSTPDYGLLRKLSLDIVDGCEYLHKKNIVHGNLAARNILVEKVASSQKVYYNAKVSDYGIIRFAECTGGNFMKIGSSGKMIPIRWAPKELVVDDNTRTDFTFASDYWSFGVVMWEMWSKGSIPYGSSYTNMRVLQFLKEGYSPVKLHRPNGCPSLMIEIMESIFKVNPAERPNFSQIKQRLKNFRGMGSRKRLEAKHGEAALGKALNENQVNNDADLKKYVPAKEGQGDVLAQGAAALGQSQRKKRKKNRTVQKNAVDVDAIGEGCQGQTKNVTGQGDVGSRDKDDGSTESAKKCTNQAPTVRKPNKTFHQNPGKEGFDTPHHQQKKPEKGGNRYDGETARKHGSQHGPQHDQKFGSRGHPYNSPQRFAPGSGNRNNNPHGRGNSRGRTVVNRNIRAPSPFNVNASFMDSHTDGSSSVMSGSSSAGAVGMPPAPPPYTPNPLPNHSSAFLPSLIGTPTSGFSASLDSPSRSRSRQHQGTDAAAVNYDEQIQQLQKQIETLKTEKLSQELIKKSEELTEVMRRLTAQKIGSGVGDSNEQHQQRQHFDRSRGPRFYQQQQPSYTPKSRGKGNGRNNGNNGGSGPHPPSPYPDNPGNRY